MMDFVLSQIKQIRSGGAATLLRKSRLVFASLLALIPVLMIRALRPIFLIRFGPIASSRIGALAPEAEIYLCERDAGLHGQRNLDIFFFPNPACNQQLKTMWDRTLLIWNLVGPIHRVNRMIPGGKAHIIPWRKYADRDIHGLLAITKSHISFTRTEEEIGQVALREMGIPDGSSFVCFHARDPSYLDQSLPNQDWSYQNVRDTDIYNYLPAVKALTGQNIYAVRMGAVVDKTLDTDDSKIIDYSVNHRSDFLDVYLSSKCRFFLGTPTGLSTGVPMTFRRPTAFADWLVMEDINSWGPDDLIIFKRLWVTAEQRYLSFPEIFGSEIVKFNRQQQFDAHGLVAIDNSPDEIVALTMEMEQRLAGTWISEDGDQELQDSFWSLVGKGDKHGTIRTRIGAAFLRENRELGG